MQHSDSALLPAYPFNSPLAAKPIIHTIKKMDQIEFKKLYFSLKLQKFTTEERSFYEKRLKTPKNKKSISSKKQ